jgi:hypothetical protein
MIPPGVTQTEWAMKSYQLGIRYDITSRIALKAQVNRYHELDDSGGLFDAIELIAKQSVLRSIDDGYSQIKR